MKAKNGDGYLFKSKSGKYSCIVTSTCVDPNTGNYKRIKRTADTREEATKLAKQALRAYEKEWKLENKYNDSLTLLFSEACEEYLEKKVRPTVKGSTFYTYQKSYEQFIKGYRKLANVQVKNLTVRTFEVIYATWVEKYSPKSIKYPVQLCRQVCKWLVERSLIQENYAEQVKPLYEIPDEVGIAKKVEHKKILTREDLQKVHNAYKANLNSEYIPVVLFLCETGLRPQEFACLKNTDIDLVNKRLNVERTSARRFVEGSTEKSEVYVKVTKTSDNRVVMLSDLAVEMIEQMQLKTKCYCKNNKNDLLYPIFRNGNIRSNATMEVGFKHLCDILDIDRDVHPTRGGQQVGINLYACRHTCETMMEAAGISPLIIGAMLGHTPQVGLKHYTHIGIDDIEQQAKTPFMLLEENKIQSNDKTDKIENIEMNEEQEMAVLRILLEKYKDKL